MGRLRGAVADVKASVGEILRRPLQALGVPACVAGRAEEDAAHVVVHADDAMPLALEMLDRFRADQPATACDQNCFSLQEGIVQ